MKMNEEMATRERVSKSMMELVAAVDLVSA